MDKLKKSFFKQDALVIAPKLIGKTIVRRLPNGTFAKSIITEIEVYKGEEDLACHCRKGRTKRTEIMYEEGGILYIYLIYGIHWMLNIVTGNINNPQAILIRAIENYNGPGKLSKALSIDGSFNGEDIENSNRIWIENDNNKYSFMTKPRIGIDYAGEIWKDKKWRFVLSE